MIQPDTRFLRKTLNADHQSDNAPAGPPRFIRLITKRMKPKMNAFRKRPPCSLFLIIGSLCYTLPAWALTHHVGNGYPYSTLMQAIAVTQPGDTIMVHAGTYPGGLSIVNLQGTPAQWIYIVTAPADTVIFLGGSNAWQMTDAAYVAIKGFIFQQQTANGLNIDDGGSYDTPTHHIIIEGCTFRNINATGNNDLLKMSGVDSFEIRNCTFLNGSPGGSGIDMVGCHDGFISDCYFENQGSNSIQAKGGSRNIRIERNFFKNGGLRSLNLGGSTGLPYFRPIDAPYEAADLKVYANIFVGSQAPIAYVGCINTEVVNNTIYLPTKWVIRILQETVDTSRFAPCGNNTFRNNIVYRDHLVTTDCNIGPDTDPQSFTFSNNLWFHAQNAAWTGPSLPVPDLNQIVGQDPLFVSAAAENFDLQPTSPAIGAGYPVSAPTLDFSANPYHNPRSIGAFEGNKISSLEPLTSCVENQLLLYPNPSRGAVQVVARITPISFLEIYNVHGKKIYACPVANTLNHAIDLFHQSAGTYFLSITTKNNTSLHKIVIQR